MLHSIPSTGIPDIDDQHRTIDNLITLYCNTISPNDEERYLTALSKAVNSHFQFVENFFDVKFPEEFKARQDEILAWLSEKIRQRVNGNLSICGSPFIQQAFPNLIRTMLISMP
jgi:hemerythrin